LKNKITKEEKDILKNHIKNGGHITVKNVCFFKSMKDNLYYISNEKYDRDDILAACCMDYIFIDLVKDKYKTVSESKFYSLLYRLSAD